VGEVQHLFVFVGVAVGVDNRERLKIVLLSNSSSLLLTAAIAVLISARQNPTPHFKLGANQVQADLLAPIREVHVDGRGDDRDNVALRLVPTDPFQRVGANHTR